MNILTHDDAATDTHIEKIKNHLLSGKKITKLEALKMFGCWNTGDVIYKLRTRQILPVETEMVKEGGRRFARYYLKSDKREVKKAK